MATPTNTTPSYAPSGFSVSSFNSPILFNPLNYLSNDRSFHKDLIEKYGTEKNYNVLMHALGKFADTDYTDNHSFYHYEQREIHPSFAVASTVTGASQITVTVGAADYTQSGALSSIRAGETLRLRSSGQQVQILSVNKTTASAHTATIKSLDGSVIASSGGSGNVLANDIFDLRGAVNVGERSTQLDSKAVVWDRVTNTITEHRDDFSISDIADMEKQEIRLGPDGNYYIRSKYIDVLNKRFLNEQSWKIMEGTPVTATGTTAGSGGGVTNGTKGLIPFVQAGGSTIQYSLGGGMQVSDFQGLARALMFYGGATEYHGLMDLASKQAMDNFLFTTFKQTYNDVSWESFKGDKEAAVAYGFDSFRMNGISWHFKFEPMFSSEMISKRPSTLGDAYANFAIFIPQKQNIGRDGEMIPSFQIVYQKQRATGDRIIVAETGLLAPTNKTTTAERTYSMITYYGTRVFGANGFSIFQGV